MEITRTLRDYTGTWYDAAEPGWGLTLSTKGDVRVGVLYYYDADNEPRWVLGQTDNALTGTMQMLSFTGFCPDCERVEPTFVAGGVLDFEFTTLRSARFESAAVYPDESGGEWVREVDVLVPLSDPPFDPRLF